MRFILCTRNHEIATLFLLLVAAVQTQAQSPPLGPDPQYQYGDFSFSTAYLAVVLVAAMFFMGLFSVYIRYCSRSANNSNLPLTDARARRATARGISPEVILTFPTFPYSDVKELKIGKGALECAVCLNEFEDDETLRLIPKCDHVFHPECIDEWLAKNTTCPVCRANLDPESGESVAELTHELESTNDEAELGESNSDTQRPCDQEVSVHVEGNLNRNRTRGRPPKFPRSHSTGHLMVKPGENTDRFTLRLSLESRKQLMNRKLNRASSMFLTSRQGSSVRGSVRGYRIGEGSSRGRSYGWPDRWGFNIPPLFSRSGSLKSPKVAASDSELSSIRSSRPGNSFGDSSRPPV